MTKAEAIRKHPFFDEYAKTRHWMPAVWIIQELEEHGISVTRQNLRDAVKWNTGRKRGGQRKPRYGTRCPYCAHELVIEVP